MERPLRLAGIDPERAYTAKEIKALKEKTKRSETAPPVIGKVHRAGTEPDPLRGLFPVTVAGGPAVVECEPDTDLRDTEQVPLTEEGGIDAFLYEISFNRYFYKPLPLRPLEEIRADILALEQETEGLLSEIVAEV